MNQARRLGLPLAIFALVAVGVVITGSVRWTLGAHAEAIEVQREPEPPKDVANRAPDRRGRVDGVGVDCGPPSNASGPGSDHGTISGAACGDSVPVVHLERDATIRTTGANVLGRVISDAP